MPSVVDMLYPDFFESVRDLMLRQIHWQTHATDLDCSPVVALLCGRMTPMGYVPRYHLERDSSRRAVLNLERYICGTASEAVPCTATDSDRKG